MSRNHKRWGVVPGLLVVAFLAACNQERLSSDRSRPGPPSKKVTGGGCPTEKFTGGGRIDPPGNHDVLDETSGGQPAAPDPLPLLTGKFTFGFNVFLATDPGGSGNCIVTKGEIEVNDHPAQIAWHVSIHDGVNAFDGQPVFASTFVDASGGVCVVVGVPFPPGTTARVNPQGGFDQVQFEACDNDPGGPQNTRSDAMRWRSVKFGDTGLTFLTGGNIVFHGS
jgi:hypothetical protein